MMTNQNNAGQGDEALTRRAEPGKAIEGRRAAAGPRRSVPPSSPVAKALEAFHTLQKKERLKAGDVYVDSGYVLREP